ncbi:5-oxoprolinase subunit B family protein [Leifsonia sp. McL0607]|uniref:5-oxoprolinase subunit B family protein n=1 Tax=Leifsonia sp. McL0607 TaxID=3415672 RepID=UPI003CE8BFCA
MSMREQARYTWGGDEFLFVEIDEAMSLAANFRVTSIAARIEHERPAGIVDICPANASLLIRFDPDLLDSGALERLVRRIESEVTATSTSIETRVIEVPVWYDDPFTAEVAARFRSGYHQDPGSTDLEYAAAVNGLADKDEFIRRHHSAPWIVSMVGFVAGLPFLYQLVEQDEQLQVPKYLSPRTDTPPLTVGHGGCFGAVYSVRGAGGYQMFGVAAAPIYDPSQRLADFRESSVLFRSGDIVRFRPIEATEYALIQEQLEAGTFRYRQAPISLDTALAASEPTATNQMILEALDVA